MSNSERTQRMVDSAPEYYQYSAIYTAIQAAQADEYDSQEAKNADLQAQFYIPTATWGLKYYEEGLGIATIESDPYDIRRSRVLAKWRGIGNFSAEMIKSIAEAFTNGEVDVTINIPAQEVTVTFIGTYGIPPNINDLKAMVDNIIHAHLGLTWKFKYLTWDDLDSRGQTWDNLDAEILTWDAFEEGGW